MAAADNRANQEGKDKRRSNCPIACSLDILGDKWALLIVRDLRLGRNRYAEFLESPENYPTSTLSQRLKHLEAHGIIEKVLYSERPPRAEYHLTAKGYALEDVLESLSLWGLRHLENVAPLTVDEPVEATADPEASPAEEVRAIAAPDTGEEPAAPSEDYAEFTHEDSEFVLAENGTSGPRQGEDVIPEPEVTYDPPPELTETPEESIPHVPAVRGSEPSEPEPAPSAERSADDDEDYGQLSLFG